MDSNLVKKFLTQYKIVFNDKGMVNACGRNSCIQLISIANKLEPNVIHGSTKTGQMEIESIIRLKKELEVY